MRVIFLAVALSLFANLATGQKKDIPLDPTKMTMEDMQRLAKMSPTEQAAFKQEMLKNAEQQLKQKAKAANITIDETLLPTSKLVLPVKDVKRLATIPVTPPSRAQLLKDVSKMEAALRSSVPAPVVQKVEEFSASRSVKEIQAAAIGGWYDNNPESALLLGMKATAKEPTDILGWNNLAALLNLTGLEHQAIPILQHCLVEKPNSSLILNNMGQSYLGLGDVSKAKQFLMQCLNIDDLNPEANHSMALIYLNENEVDKALQHFEKELLIAQRRSTLAQLVKSGKRERINLAALRKQKMQLDGTDNRDFFEEINLNKFKIPDPPENSRSSAAWRAEHAALGTAISEEIMFWLNASQTSPEVLVDEGKKYPGVYQDLVNELLGDLGDQYIPLLAIVEEDDVPYLTQLHYDYAKKDKETVCPEPPIIAGQGEVVMEAYEKKCCDLKTPLIDDLMYKYNSFISAKIKKAHSNHKQYLNGLINIVQLDPSAGNKIMVYHAVANYFTFLETAMGAYLVKEEHMSCRSKLTAQEADDIIKSARNINLSCPSWLKMSMSVGVAKLKADCAGFGVEAGIYKLIHVGAEKKFATGVSTLYVGAGIEGSFKKIAKGSIKQQFYVSFDHNNEFADLGMRGSASGDLVSGALGADFSYDFALNGGFNAQGKVKSNWVDNYEKAMNYVSK